jgi:uncharacterized protein (DUF2235 family)
MSYQIHNQGNIYRVFSTVAGGYITGDLTLRKVKDFWMRDLCRDDDPKESARNLKDHLACNGDYGSALIAKKRLSPDLIKAWKLVDPAKYYKWLSRRSPRDLRLASIAKTATTEKWIYACIPDADLCGLTKAHFIEACALKGRPVHVYRNRSAPGLVVSEIGKDDIGGYGPTTVR